MAERTKMPQGDRARQFNPFDALKGLQDALRMKEYEHERIVKQDVDEDEIRELSKIILEIEKNDRVSVEFFEDGHYLSVCGSCVIDFNEKTIQIERKTISFDDIKKIDILSK